MTAQELAEIITQRFKGVPNFTDNDADALVEDAMRTHGYAPSSSVDAKDVTLILLYAQYNGAWQVALSTAHYFKFGDGEENVDKSMVAENYRKLARGLQEDYEAEKGRLYGNSFKLAPRIDRPITMPARKQVSRRWRR